MQRLKVASVKSYVEATNEFRNKITVLENSPNEMKETIIKAAKSMRENIEKNSYY